MKRLLTASLLLTLSLCGLTGCMAPAASTPAEADPEPVTREEIKTDKAPAAIGPYSQAQRVGNRLYLSGQIGFDPATGQLVEGVEAQTRQVLANLHAVLQEAGFAKTDVVQAQVFLADLEDYATMNGIYAEFFGDHRPARAAFQVARLPRDAEVEIIFVAEKL